MEDRTCIYIVYIGQKIVRGWIQANTPLDQFLKLLDML